MALYGGQTTGGWQDCTSPEEYKGFYGNGNVWWKQETGLDTRSITFRLFPCALQAPLAPEGVCIPVG